MYQIAICDDEVSELDKVEQILQSYQTPLMQGDLRSGGLRIRRSCSCR